MKILLWVCNEPNQKALACKINEIFPLAGIITESRKHKRRVTLRKLVLRLYEKLFLPSIDNAWVNMQEYCEKNYPGWPAVTMLDVENINSDEAYVFTKEINADLIIVSGTRMIREKMLLLDFPVGILNLHTGLSPYVKGGPNCTNWCIATEQFHLIGNTIMWIDKGIDTGNIAATEFTPLDGSETLQTVHIKVIDHAHDLYVRCIQAIAGGFSNNIKQTEIAPGRTFYNKDWTTAQKIDLVRNMKKMKDAFQSGSVDQKKMTIKTVPLSSGFTAAK